MVSLVVFMYRSLSTNRKLIVPVESFSVVTISSVALLVSACTAAFALPPSGVLEANA